MKRKGAVAKILQAWRSLAGLVGALVFLLAIEAPGMGRPPQGGRFDFGKVVEQAKADAAKPYVPPAELPAGFPDVGYDQWRGIRFQKDQALWRRDRSRFTIEFFQRGFLYKHPVRINVVDAGGAHPVKFARELFDYGQTGLADKVPADLGFSGFRIHHPLNRPDYFDEVVSFLGASYFRAVAKGQQYGLSARALAINTGTDEGEEFPSFREFWILKPSPRDQQLTVFALLDSPSLTGAYLFQIQPGNKTIMRVKATLFMRKPVKKLGLAPVSSMFFCGENQNCQNDFRPEIHDSDGLLIAAKSGEWIWRPVSNPQRLRINHFGGGVPIGFGTLQRDTDFDHYQDLEARYDLRPSLWIVPEKGWDDGQLELLEIPTQNEYHDNIAAYWTVAAPPAAGATLEYSYRLEWYNARAPRSKLGRVIATRLKQMEPISNVQFVLDFAGGALTGITSTNQLQAEVHAADGYRIEKQNLIRNTVTGGWRLTLQLVSARDVIREKLLPSTLPPVNLRALLKHNGQPVTETWNYSFPP